MNRQAKIVLLKKIDAMIGGLIVRAVPRLRREHSRIRASLHDILIIRPGGIGDAVLLLPAIALLKRQFPASKIDVLGEKRNAAVFKLSEETNQVYLYDKGADLFRCLRNSYDIVIDSEQWHRLSAAVAYLTGAPSRLGFDTNERGQLFTEKIPYSHDDYEVYSFLNLLKPLTDKALEFNVDEPFINPVKGFSSQFLAELMRVEGKFISVFPGASVAERRWGGDNYGKVSKALLQEGFTVLLLGSSADGNEAEAIKKHAKGCIDLTGKTSLLDVAGVLRMSKLLITADSGLMHLAYGVGTPTVSLFGPGRQKKWAPRSRRHAVLSKGVTCSPCTTFGYTPRCEENVQCMSLIRVDEVVDIAERLLVEKS